MRYRLGGPLDIPAMMELYLQFLRGKNTVYPHNEKGSHKDGEEYAMSVLLGMMNQDPRVSYFSVVGVVGSTLNGEQVVGGKPKAMISVTVSQRMVGGPKKYAFCDLLVVDEKLQRRGHAAKLVLIACREAFARGAEVFETSWSYGSPIGRVWEAVGMRPYHVSAAWILEDGTPRTDYIRLEGTRPVGNNRAAAANGHDVEVEA